MAITTATVIPRGSILNGDVCIVGGGPAGISAALRIARRSDLRVVVLESGGLEAEPEAQALNEGFNDGLDYYDLVETRNRVLGGSSHKWAGWCRPQDPIDFAGRPWAGSRGWPISYETMVPYFKGAAEMCQLESEQWSIASGASLPLLYLPPFVSGDVEIALWQGSPPTKFGIAYRDELLASKQVTVVTEGTATEITTEDGRATGVLVKSLSGNEFSITARVTVLAAGGLETPRLLLASRSQNPLGLGNENDNVGRYFAEHPHLVTGRIEVFSREKSGRVTLDALDRGAGGVRARLAMQRPHGSMKVAYTISRARQESDGLLNFSTHLRTISTVSREDSDAYQAFKLALGNLRSPRRFLTQVRSRSLPDGSGKLLGRLVRGAPEIWKVIYQEALRKPSQLALYTQCEQSPNRDSRVTLDDRSTDALGVPKLRLNWRLNRTDKESVARAQQIVGDQLEATGLGRLVAEPFLAEDSDSWGPNLRGGHHQMGTARMSTDPADGVVDTDGRVHTVRDLYVADASVFPVAGYANPLFTAVAWALRVADGLVTHFDEQAHRGPR